MSRQARRDYARGVASAFEDLSDGAFFAAMEEMGVDVEDLIDEPEPPQPKRTHRCQTCGRKFRTNDARDQHAKDKHAPPTPTRS